ncbi:BglII/BstYI family type II restriction endonuclease [Sedimentitalea todarodis]|uniref:BglII/BstYI family type II restriction endonuclease n=1 Tax=Sedimentitalea todarodis TaxID=1631240 RepID=A0ABU3V7W6_9RHOB|nr:BglII/BstYI family type II restriction endonuclease [Sedimentitalea todarodis]MDU9002268.1 BglII/BstYI family type II restriction endonuclease [Sedimentitalea todarodis]
MLERLRELGFDIATRNHADAILSFDFAEDLDSLVARLAAFRIHISELIGGGGGESGQTQRLRRALDAGGWRKHHFSVETIVDGQTRAGVSHEVDHVRFADNGTLALEIEWNNKDPFFDRDLENFQRLHGLSAISVGIIVTRGASMQDAFLPRITGWMKAQGLDSEEHLERLGITERTRAQRDAVARQVERGVPFAEAFAKTFVASKFGQASTHWSKLDERVARGVGNPCPLLLVGLPADVLVDAAASVIRDTATAPDLFSRNG